MNQAAARPILRLPDRMNDHLGEVTYVDQGALIVRQLAASPVRILARWVKRAFHVSIERASRVTSVRPSDNAIGPSSSCDQDTD
jgi:hypothetical protein